MQINKSCMFLFIALFSAFSAPNLHAGFWHWLSSAPKAMRQFAAHNPKLTKYGLPALAAGACVGLYLWYTRPLIVKHTFNGEMPQEAYDITRRDAIVNDVLTYVQQHDKAEIHTSQQDLKNNDSYYVESVGWLTKEVKKHIFRNTVCTTQEYANHLQHDRFTRQLDALEDEGLQQEIRKKYQPVIFNWELCCKGIALTKKALQWQEAITKFTAKQLEEDAPRVKKIEQEHLVLEHPEEVQKKIKKILLNDSLKFETNLFKISDATDEDDSQKTSYEIRKTTGSIFRAHENNTTKKYSVVSIPSEDVISSEQKDKTLITIDANPKEDKNAVKKAHTKKLNELFKDCATWQSIDELCVVGHQKTNDFFTKYVVPYLSKKRNNFVYPHLQGRAFKSVKEDCAQHWDQLAKNIADNNLEDIKSLNNKICAMIGNEYSRLHKDMVDGNASYFKKILSKGKILQARQEFDYWLKNKNDRENQIEQLNDLFKNDTDWKSINKKCVIADVDYAIECQKVSDFFKDTLVSFLDKNKKDFLHYPHLAGRALKQVKEECVCDYDEIWYTRFFVDDPVIDSKRDKRCCRKICLKSERGNKEILNTIDIMLQEECDKLLKREQKSDN